MILLKKTNYFYCKEIMIYAKEDKLNAKSFQKRILHKRLKRKKWAFTQPCVNAHFSVIFSSQFTVLNIHDTNVWKK